MIGGERGLFWGRMNDQRISRVDFKSTSPRKVTQSVKVIPVSQLKQKGTYCMSDSSDTGKCWRQGIILVITGDYHAGDQIKPLKRKLGLFQASFEKTQDSCQK